MFGIIFIILGNLSGNALSFGSFVMKAAGHHEPAKKYVIGLAIAALSAAILLHVCSRRGGIIINNCFAVVKVLLLSTIIILGFLKAAGSDLGGEPSSTENFNVSESFSTKRHDLASYSDSLLYVMYTYSGFKQPFYVLSEIRKPRMRLPRYTIIAVSISAVLFMLVNIAYLCVVPKDVQLRTDDDMATLFLGRIFGNEGAKKAMAAMIAISIFGNIVVMTFTASRVKQEIAKEGILPFSLVIATGHTTPYALLKAKWKRRSGTPVDDTIDNHLEQTPIAALGVHWLSSIVLIAVTSMLSPTTAYNVLVSLYSFVINAGIGVFVTGGLLYLKFRPKSDWNIVSDFTPWLNPLPALIYFGACCFVIFASFAPPSTGSPYSYERSHIQWYIVPAIGLSSLLWGIAWFCGLELVLLQRRERLIVVRTPLIVEDPDQEGKYIMKSEVVTHHRHTISGQPHQV
jgi:amino acid transporter